MEENKQDKFKRACATLSSLRNNIAPTSSPIPEKYVREFHTALDRLQGIGIDVSEFRIPSSEVKRVSRGGSYVTGETWYSDEKYLDKPYFLTKTDAIIGYFEIITSEKPRRIGFSK
jgi:hypothetical protein